MPIVSAFFGIIIRIAGEISSATARKYIRQWARLRQAELEANWERAQKLQRLENIAPLEADIREFKRFFISGGTVCWPNADIAPETLGK